MASGADNSSEQDPVDVLAEEFAARLRRGERPSVSDYAAAHPEHADQIRQVLPAVAQIELLKQHRKAAPAVHSERMPERLGDFRIVRELGRGGMGVVFEAIQESLGRRVALKVLAFHSQFDAERRERFVREAKAAAQLHHTNIVPVFGVGEQDGLPYYVMQLIPGHGLNAIVAEWKAVARRDTKPIKPQLQSTVIANEQLAAEPAPPVEAPLPEPIPPSRGDWAFVAAIGAQVAHALDYAHHKGILHRDVKPANLLLDDRGEVWVVDFGLAKLATDRGITTTGHVVGTLQYLAPECLRGEAGPASDIYGLGATLYELLTLAAPFDGEDPTRIMQQIANSPPVDPRRINPQIPRDLETIVLKAMAREPRRRYATAKDMADDLEAFLDDRPIRARRESLPERMWRWSRHHPAVAVLSCCTAAAILLAASVGWVGYARTKAALASEEKKRDEAEALSEKLEANLDLSLAAFEKVFEAAGGDDFRFGPRGGGPPPPPFHDSADKAAVLEAVLAFYDKFAEQNATNSRLRFEAGKAHRRVGEMHQMFGRNEKAAVAFQRAATLLEGVQNESVDDSEVRYELMVLYSNMPAADGSVEAQLLKAESLAHDFTTTPRSWAAAAVYLKLGWAREQARNLASAESLYAKAAELYVGDTDDHFRPPHVIGEQAIARQRLAALLADRNHFAEAIKILEAAADELRPMVGGPGGPNRRGPGGPGGPGGRFAREALASIYQQLAEVYAHQGDGDKAALYRYQAQKMQEGPPGGPKGFGGPKKGPFPKGPPPKK